MSCKIYIITNKINKKVYIGQTWLSLNRRMWRHANDDNQTKIHRAILKYGVENFQINTLVETWSQENADYIEIQFIKDYDSINNGYNLTHGGLGGRHSEETKLKMSRSRKGKKRPEDFKIRLSNMRKGAGNPMFGKKMSEDHKNKISDSLKGRTNAGSFVKGQMDLSGEKNPRSKLKEIEVIEIKRLLASKEVSVKQIAAQFNVSNSLIKAIKSGRAWKHI